ncbi:hypothetical protein ACLMJK_007767 [Lecanora helva]
MSGIISGLQHLFSSVIEIFTGIINTIVSLFQSALTTLLAAFSSLLELFQSLIASIFDLMSGMIGFVLGNIVIIGVLTAAYVGYSAYKQKNNQGGRGITGRKKRA